MCGRCGQSVPGVVGSGCGRWKDRAREDARGGIRPSGMRGGGRFCVGWFPVQSVQGGAVQGKENGTALGIMLRAAPKSLVLSRDGWILTTGHGRT